MALLILSRANLGLSYQRPALGSSLASRREFVKQNIDK
jgi:hypothetical protein